MHRYIQLNSSGRRLWPEKAWVTLPRLLHKTQNGQLAGASPQALARPLFELRLRQAQVNEGSSRIIEVTPEKQLQASLLLRSPIPAHLLAH
jgi:hypothetical protein